jgi:hypothetical protein
MKIRQLVLLAVVSAWVAVSAMAQAGNCTQPDSSTRPDCPGAIAFFRSFQLAFRKNDRERVASLVAYPVLTNLRHKKVRIKSRSELLAHFDEIFDGGVRCAILSATGKDVWGNWRGFTVDGGAVCFDGMVPPGERPHTQAPDYWTKYPFKIITINNDGQYPCKAS